MPSPHLSVIVPVHQGGEPVRVCLRALARAIQPQDEVIVVLDGFRGLLDEAKGLAVRTIQIAEQSGPARARNAGAAAARGDVLLFIDSDVEIHPDTLERVRAHFAGDPDLDALIGSYDDEPGDSSLLSRYRNLLHHFTHQHSNPEAQTFWGACGAVRRRVFHQIGGFDDRYRRPSVEDLELGYRLSARGGRILLNPQVQVKHLKTWTLKEILRTDVVRRAAPWTRLLLAYRTVPADLNLQWRQRWSVVLSYAALATLLAGLWSPIALMGLPISLVALYLLNRDFHTFMRGRMPLHARPMVHLWHWLFYLCAGAGAVLGILQYAFSGGQIVSQPDMRSASLGFTTLS